MILKICEDNFLFENLKYIDGLCYFVVFLCILLSIVFHIGESKRMKTLKFSILAAYICFAFLVFIILFQSFLNHSAKGCACQLAPDTEVYKDIEEYQIADISHNKVIIIGDSRMELIRLGKNILKIPINFEFISKGGATIYWTKDTAIPTLIEKLSQKDDDFKYIVFHTVFFLLIYEITTHNFVSVVCSS